MQQKSSTFVPRSGHPKFGHATHNGHTAHQPAGNSGPGPWTPTTASPLAKRKKRDEESPQLQYATEIKKTSRFYRKDGVLYRWNGHCFSVVATEDAESHAFNWLALHFPERATPESARSCTNAAKMLAPPVPARDPDRIIIPLKNAYLEVKDDQTIEQHEPSKEFGITFALNITLPSKGKCYQPGVLSPSSQLAKYLTTSLPEVEVQNYLQELAGNTLTTSAKFQIAMVLKGTGSNGKSVFMNVLSALHNPVASMRLDQLSDFYLTPLIGASLVVVDEVPKSGINEQTLKSLISGENITINRKHRDAIGYRPTAKWVIATNNDQKSLDNSHGFWRRLVFIPFTQEVSGPQLIRGLDRIIIDKELQLFLDWCLLGLLRLMGRGALPAEPTAVSLAKKDAIEASNSVVAWSSDEELKLHAHAFVTKDTVYQRYRTWCTRQGLRALSGGQFWKALRAIYPDLKEEQRRVTSDQRPRLVNLQFPNDQISSNDSPPFD